MIDTASPTFALLVVVVALGALVQGSIGFGYALVAAPVFSLVAPAGVPGTLLALGIPLNVAVLVREHRVVRVRGFTSTGLALAAGTAVGFAILTTMPRDSLTAAFGGAIVVAVAATAFAPDFEPGRRAHVVAGIAAGAINTVAATGGPPLAIVHHRSSGHVLRATLALAFLVSSAMSLAVAIPAGRLGWFQVRLAAALLPALAAGFAVSHRIAHRLDRRWLRPAVLAFAAASGLAAMIKGLA